MSKFQNGNSWADVLKEAVESGVDKVPKGWQTMRQIADEIGMSRPRTSALMQAAMDGDVMEIKKFRIRAGQRIQPVPHYRLK